MAADGVPKAWLFPQLLAIARRWLDECVICKDNTFPQMLLLVEKAHGAAERIYRSFVASDGGEKRLMPILQPYESVGSTRHVDFQTARDVYPTDPDKCHISHVVCDTTSWEQKLAQSLEEMEEVACYVKNQSLGFTVPYSLDGQEHNYLPDYIVRIRQPSSPHPSDKPSPSGGGEGEVRAADGHLNLILEVTGQKKRDKEAKAATAEALWVPAVNNHGGLGSWAYLEITDPWNAKNAIRGFLDRMRGTRNEASGSEMEDPLLADLIRRLVGALHPERIYLFGSRARGDQVTDSDFDVLVVVKEAEERRRELQYKGRQALWHFGSPVDLVVMDTQRFEEDLPVVASLPATVQREGRLIYAAA